MLQGGGYMRLFIVLDLVNIYCSRIHTHGVAIIVIYIAWGVMNFVFPGANVQIKFNIIDNITRKCV